MKKLLTSMIRSAVLATFMFSGSALAFQTGTAKDAKSKMANTATANPASWDTDIADAKTKRLVWVNVNTKVYHKDGQFYGKTKQGKFMTEAEAQKAGFRAKESGVKKKSVDSKK